MAEANTPDTGETTPPRTVTFTVRITIEDLPAPRTGVSKEEVQEYLLVYLRHHQAALEASLKSYAVGQIVQHVPFFAPQLTLRELGRPVG